MHDPHVNLMHYKINSDASVSYDNPAPLTFASELGEFKAENGWLTVRPYEHYASESEARIAIESFLEAWKIKSDLTTNIGRIYFSFDHLDFIDRNPQPNLNHQFQAAGCLEGAVHLTMTMEAHVTLRKYPPAPESFRATALVAHAYRRWKSYHSGSDTLQSMAYFILTVIESESGGGPNDSKRRLAAARYFIDYDVLNLLGHLVSTKGNALSARKIDSGVLEELSVLEKHWVEEVIKKIITRLGEYPFDRDPTLVNLDNLPRLT